MSEVEGLGYALTAHLSSQLVLIDVSDPDLPDLHVFERGMWRQVDLSVSPQGGATISLMEATVS